MPQTAVIDKATALAVLRTVNLLDESGQFAIDIGGSLAKLIYVQRNGDTERSLVIKKLDQNWSGAHLSVPIAEIGVKLHFFAFETRNIGDLVKFFHEQWGLLGAEARDVENVRATGGGAVKYAQLFSDELGVKLHHLDELTCLVRGLNFLLTKVCSPSSRRTLFYSKIPSSIPIPFSIHSSSVHDLCLRPNLF